MDRTSPAHRSDKSMDRPAPTSRIATLPAVTGQAGIRKVALDLLVGLPVSAAAVWVFLAYLGMV